MITTKPILAGSLLGSAFLCMIGVCGQQADAPTPKLDLAFKLSFYSRSSRVFFCKEAPVTLYVTQDFEQGIQDKFKTHKGEMLMVFEGGALTLKGLGVRECPREETFGGGAYPGFLDTIRLGDLLAVDLFPPKDSWDVSSAKVAAHIPFSLNGKTTYTQFVVTLDGTKSSQGKTQVALVDEKTGTSLRDLAYETVRPGVPWIWACDLNGDSIPEVIMGQESWSTKTIYVFSFTPERFKALAGLSATIWEFSGNNALPCKGAEIFEKGHVQQISLRP